VACFLTDQSTFITHRLEKNMKNVLIASMIVLLAGCTTIAPSQTYRPANYAGAAWDISGEMDDSHGMVIIKINNEIVINHALAAWTGDGEFTGYYKNKPVTASCITDGTNTTHCFVFVNGEKAATLTFD
jgi:hypothetical protein